MAVDLEDDGIELNLAIFVDLKDVIHKWQLLSSNTFINGSCYPAIHS